MNITMSRSSSASHWPGLLSWWWCRVYPFENKPLLGKKGNFASNSRIHMSRVSRPEVLGASTIAKALDCAQKSSSVYFLDRQLSEFW